MEYLFCSSKSTSNRLSLRCIYSSYHPSLVQTCLMDTLWKLWPEMAAYGHRAAQFVDILGYVTVSSRDLLAQRPELKQTVCQQAIGQLNGLNGLLARHPSAHIYTQLASLVNFDGYYLESEPCSVCNNPELPNSTMKLMAMKSEVRYSPNAMFVKLKSSFAISQFTISIADIKKSKMVCVWGGGRWATHTPCVVSYSICHFVVWLWSRGGMYNNVTSCTIPSPPLPPPLPPG